MEDLKQDLSTKEGLAESQKDLKLDLTTKEGLTKSQKTLKHFVVGSGIVVSREKTCISGKKTKTTLDIDFEGMFKNFTDLIKDVIGRIIDIFDDTKKLEKQMELAKQTIEVARAGGAKSIEITLNSKNSGALELYLEESEAKIGGKYEKDNSMTYVIEF